MKLIYIIGIGYGVFLIAVLILSIISVKRAYKLPKDSDLFDKK